MREVCAAARILCARPSSSRAAQNMEFNCQGGKMNRGLSVLDSFRRLIAPREPTAEEEEDVRAPHPPPLEGAGL